MNLTFCYVKVPVILNSIGRSIIMVMPSLTFGLVQSMSMFNPKIQTLKCSRLKLMMKNYRPGQPNWEF